MMETLQLISLTKAARILHIGKDSLYNLIRSGKIKTINNGGKHNKISISELQRFVDEEAKVDLSVYSVTPLKSKITNNKKDFSGKDLFRKIKEELIN